MRDLAARVRSHAGLKLACTVVAALVFAAGYVPLGRFPLLAPRELPLTWLDRVVPFAPGWIVVYHSMYPLLLGAAWLSSDRAGIVRYTRALVVQMAVCFAVFAVFPVVGPRPAGAGDGGFWVYRVAAALDTPLNSFPSLHAAFLTTAVVHMWRPLRRARQNVLLAAAVVWALAVLASTLLTKQHYFLDLPAGAVVAVVCCWLAGRWTQMRSSEASDASKSQVGRR